MAKFLQIWRGRHNNISLVLYKKLKLLLSHYCCVSFTYALDTDCIHLSQSDKEIPCRYNFSFRYGKNLTAPSGKSVAALCMHPVLCFPGLIYSLFIESENILDWKEPLKVIWPNLQTVNRDRFLGVLSKSTLNVSRDGSYTASLATCSNVSSPSF